jgi:uncharacterized protein (DUF2336 family)
LIVERFLEWAAVAPPHMRAEAVGALARSYLHGDLEPHVRAEVESVLTCILDDAAISVRCAIAEAFAASAEAPHAIVLSLAQDAPDVAEPILRRSPLLADAELVDLVALGGQRVQTAIANRSTVSAPLAAAIAEVGTAGACAALAGNPGARLTFSGAARIATRHGGDGAVRDALIARADLGPELRAVLMHSVADALSSFVTGCGWLRADRARKAADEACERGAIAIAAGAPDARAFVLHLAAHGQFSPSLALRALLSRDLVLFEAALTALSGQSPRRVAGFVRDFEGRGFAAVFAEAGFPKATLPVFRAALAAEREIGFAGSPAGERTLSRRIVERALTACEGAAAEGLASMRALLRRFAVEAARDEARRAYANPDAEVAEAA